MKTVRFSLTLLLFGMGASCSRKDVVHALTRTYGGSSQLAPGDPEGEVNYAGTLMIENIETELSAAGYSGDLVAKVVSKAKAEVSLAGSLAFGSQEEITLNLQANDLQLSESETNATVGIAAEAVARGAISALSYDSKSSLSEKIQTEDFFGLTGSVLSTGLALMAEIPSFQFRHDNRFTLATGIPTLDTVSYIAKGQIKGLSAIKSAGKISNLDSEAIGITTKRMTSALFSVSSQIGMASETTAGELAGNVMKTIISTVAASELKENAGSIIAKIPQSIDGFKQLKLSASTLGETSKSIVNECVSGIKVANFQGDTQSLVTKIVTASVTGAFQAAASTESVATATASAAKAAFVSFTSLVPEVDTLATKGAAKAIFSSAMSTFDTIPGWKIDLLNVVSTELGAKALEAVKEVGFTGDTGASVVSEISVGILDSAATMNSLKNLAVDQATLKNSFSGLSQVTTTGIQESFPDATGNYTTTLEQAIDKVTANTTVANTAPIITLTSGTQSIIQVPEDNPASLILFSISDPETPIACRSVTATSSNMTLIPTSSLVISGSAPSCSVGIAPSPNQNGTTLITLSVSDGALSSMQSFTVYVTPVNDIPSISTLASPQTVSIGTPFDIPVTINDVDGPPTAITNNCDSYFLRSNQSGPASVPVMYLGNWPNCLARVTVPSSGYASPISISFQVSDDGVNFSTPQSLLLNIGATGWYQEAYIKASNAASGDSFGSSVAISGDTAIVGAPYQDSTQNFISPGTTISASGTTRESVGAAYVFKRSGSNWFQEAYIKPSNASNPEAYFGNSVALSGDTAIVGSYGEKSTSRVITNGTTIPPATSGLNVGASYIYKRIGSNWIQEAYVKAANADTSDNFGTSVYISGDTAVVGANGEDSNQTTITNGAGASATNLLPGDYGAAYIYSRGTFWAQQAYIKASNPGASDQLGFSVAISGDTVIVGALNEGNNQTTIISGKNSPSYSGAGYIFRRSNNTWVQEAYLKAWNADSSDYFGTSVAVSGDTVIVGAPSEDSSSTLIITNLPPSIADNNLAAESGAAYVFERNLSNPPVWSQKAYVKASNASSPANFGQSVSISGGTIVMGAPYESSSQTTITNGSGSSTDTSILNSGASYIYKPLQNGVWAQDSYIKGSNSDLYDSFGWSSGVSGDTVIVGAPNENSTQTTITNGSTAPAEKVLNTYGAVYVYRNIDRLFNPDLRIAAKSTTSVTLSWGSNLGKSTQVKIAPAVVAPSTGTGTTPTACTDPASIDLGSGVTSFIYSGLTQGIKYGFRVCAVDGTNVSEGSVIWETPN